MYFITISNTDITSENILYLLENDIRFNITIGSEEDVDLLSVVKREHNKIGNEVCRR